MRLLLIAVILAFLTVLPVVVVGVKNADGAYTDNTYNRSLDYDRGRKIAQKSGFSWGEPICIDIECRLAYGGVERVSLRVFRPTESQELLLKTDNEQAVFRYMGDGWYIVKVDYEKDGVLVSDEKSFFIKL